MDAIQVITTITIGLTIAVWCFIAGSAHGRADSYEACERQAIALGLASLNKETGKVLWTEDENKYLCKKRVGF